MAAKNVPNLYDLAGEGITVSYSTTGIDGKPRLSYKKGRQSLSFSGKEIESLETAIGTLVTVVIANVPDRGTTRFSLLLPAIQLPEKSRRVTVRAIGITTVTATTIAGPPPGVQQTYKTAGLKGSAQQVEFLLAKRAGG